MKLNRLQSVYIALLPLCFLLTACDKKPDDATADTAQHATDSVVYRPVQAMVVGESTVSNTHVFSGLVQAAQESALSFRVAGTVTNLRVSIGEYVRKGALIAQLDNTDYHVNLSSSLANEKNAAAAQQAVRANIKQSESELIRLRSAYDRAERLYETNSISVAEFEQARSAWQAGEAGYEASKLQYDSARAQSDAAVQQSKSAQNQLRYTRLNAPFSGVISQVNVEENEQVGAGSPIVVLSNPSQTEIEVGLPASIISQVKKGSTVSVKFFTLPNKTFQGVVSEVGFSTVNSSVYPVVIRLLKPGRLVRPGMTGDVTFDFGSNQTDVVVVPTTAVSEDKSGKFVYILTPDKKIKHPHNPQKMIQLYVIERRDVSLGQLMSDGFVVLSGLAAGERIAQAGLNVIQSGDHVTLYIPKA